MFASERVHETAKLFHLLLENGIEDELKASAGIRRKREFLLRMTLIEMNLSVCDLQRVVGNPKTNNNEVRQLLAQANSIATHTVKCGKRPTDFKIANDSSATLSSWLSKILTESLILAQDERWRRA